MNTLLLLNSWVNAQDRTTRWASLLAVLVGSFAGSIQTQGQNLVINGDFETTDAGSFVITTGLVEDLTGNPKPNTFEPELYLTERTTTDTAGNSAGALKVTIPASRHEFASTGNHGLFVVTQNIPAGSRVRVEFDAKWIGGPSKVLNVQRPWTGPQLGAQVTLAETWGHHAVEFDYHWDGPHICLSFVPDANQLWYDVSLGGVFLLDNIDVTIIE